MSEEATEAMLEEPAAEPGPEFVELEPIAIELPHGNLLDAEESEEAAAAEPEPAGETEPVAAEPMPYEELARREQEAAARATALQSRLGEMAADRRQLKASLDQLNARLQPIEEMSAAQRAAAQALEEARTAPTDPAERFKYDLLKDIDERVGGRVAALEQQIAPVAQALSQTATNQQHHQQLENQAAVLQQRADHEDATIPSEVWAQVQQWEINQTKYLMDRGLPMETARARAVEKRYQLYMQHWAAQQSGQADPNLSAPLALVEEARAWGATPPANGSNGTATASAAVQHHRELQREEPVPPSALGPPPATGSPIDTIARKFKSGYYLRDDKGEELGAAVDWATQELRKKHPNLETDDIERMIIDRTEQL